MLLPFRFCLVLSRNNIDWIHFNIGFEPFSLLRDFPLFLIAKMFRKKILLHVHGGRYVLAKPKAFLLKILIHIFFKYSNSILALSNKEKTALVENYNLCNNSVTVLSNGISISSLVELSEKSFVSKLSILYLGRIDANKGLKEILAALEILVAENLDFEFCVCGTGPQKDSFLVECRRILGDKLKYKGIVFGNLKQQVLKDSHLFLLPSYFEGLPISLLETMANYVVPIVTPVGSMPDVVKSGKNGFLVNSVDDIVNVIFEMSKNRDRLVQIADNAAQYVRENYSMDEYVNRINKLYYENK